LLFTSTQNSLQQLFNHLSRHSGDIIATAPTQVLFLSSIISELTIHANLPSVSSASSQLDPDVRKWTQEEVQTWFKQGKFAKYAHHFRLCDGVDLAALTKDDFQTLAKSADGIVLYNAVQSLLKTSSCTELMSLSCLYLIVNFFPKPFPH
jgi:hypothetical protein